jgi:hypothetical protein
VNAGAKEADFCNDAQLDLQYRNPLSANSLEAVFANNLFGQVLQR